MAWCWTVGRLRGIPIRVHATMVPAALIVAAGAMLRFQNIWEGAYGVGFFLLLSGTVMAAALGQAVAASGFGSAVRNLTLTPIGAFVEVDRPPGRMRDLWLTAAAGLLIGFAGTVLLTALDDSLPIKYNDHLLLRGEFLFWTFNQCAWIGAVALLSAGRWLSVSTSPLWVL